MAGRLPLLSASYRGLIRKAHGAKNMTAQTHPSCSGRRDSFSPSLFRIAIVPVENTAGTEMAARKMKFSGGEPPRPNG